MKSKYGLFKPHLSINTLPHFRTFSFLKLNCQLNLHFPPTHPSHTSEKPTKKKLTTIFHTFHFVVHAAHFQYFSKFKSMFFPKSFRRCNLLTIFTRSALRAWQLPRPARVCPHKLQYQRAISQAHWQTEGRLVEYLRYYARRY